MRIVIIEDEPLTARDLERTICSISKEHVIVKVLQSKEEGIEYFNQTGTFDLIFSDIQLGDGLSFEIFEAVEVQVPVIYVTAFNQYALEAFRNFGVDYVLKPFDKKSIENALNKWANIKGVFEKDSNLNLEFIETLKTHLPKTGNTSILIQKRDKIIPIKSSEIALFYTEHDTVWAVTFDSNQYVVSQKLFDLEEIFPSLFFRVNRQFLVNRTAIKDVSQHFHRKLLVNLTIPFRNQIVIGKLKSTAFLSWLQNS